MNALDRSLMRQAFLQPDTLLVANPHPLPSKIIFSPSPLNNELLKAGHSFLEDCKQITFYKGGLCLWLVFTHKVKGNIKTYIHTHTQ